MKQVIHPGTALGFRTEGAVLRTGNSLERDDP
jgi:hypothetical protein